ncbi:N-acyl-D-amino-acid deacylase family protein [Agromyces archimandritae]|uniref:Amidohydrolase family protein n=1 Tax=Agromyces archimandritae TaxID=2781962 RepID=A0A975IMU2_9MICO|nr:amidohydrolase family protein [Agromyces archimandritae]QTX03892.1 amidohydrolase family protein [Agromyces archimandritae]
MPALLMPTTLMPTTLITGGLVVDAEQEPHAADVLADGGRIAAVSAPGRLSPREADAVVDAAGRLIMPGLIDAHAHVDGLVFDPDVQLALLRQGVTSTICGQDGVGFAPGDGRYAAEYFAAIDGGDPRRLRGADAARRASGPAPDGIGAQLAGYDGRTAVNVALLVPAGTVRHEVLGRASRAPDAAELAAMRRLVETGLAEGAVGLSTGLDYVPGIFADTAELTELARPLAAAGAAYVSHMRGGYEANSAAGIAEIAEIAAGSGARVHVSHFHAAADTVLGLLGELAAAGVDASFDAYPYTRGCSLLSMPFLPPELTVLPAAALIPRLADPAERARLRRDWFPELDAYASVGPRWRELMTFAHIAAPEYAWAHGLTFAEATRRAGAADEIAFGLDVLVASRLETSIVMAVPDARPPAELARIFAHPGHLGGSDGIFIGAHPHPRARGAFARYLRETVRELRAWSWQDAAAHLSARTAERFGLGERGLIREGWIADLALVDPDGVADTADYDAPLGLARGIDDVFVAGVPVLAGGRLTGATPGAGIRRQPVRRGIHRGTRSERN